MSYIRLFDWLDVTIEHFAPVAVGSSMYRVILGLRSVKPKSEAGKLFKEYEVWVTQEAVEDELRLVKGANDNDILQYAIDLLRGRCSDTMKESSAHSPIPEENGVFIPKAGEKYIGHPATFPIKVTNREDLVKTTIQLPRSTLKWLKKYGVDRNIGLGEAIRRVMEDFIAQDGYANYRIIEGHWSTSPDDDHESDDEDCTYIVLDRGGNVVGGIFNKRVDAKKLVDRLSKKN